MSSSLKLTFWQNLRLCHSFMSRRISIIMECCYENPTNYRTLHSYNLIWAVCHLFPQQRWRTHTYSVSENHWPGEPLDLRKTTSARKFRPAFGTTSKTRIFYKYVVFKHSSPFYTNSSLRIHALSSVWHSSYSSTGVKSKKMDEPRRHSFLQYTLTMKLFQSQRNRLFRITKRKTFKYVIQLNRTFSSLTFL